MPSRDKRARLHSDHDHKRHQRGRTPQLRERIRPPARGETPTLSLAPCGPDGAEQFVAVALIARRYLEAEPCSPVQLIRTSRKAPVQ